MTNARLYRDSRNQVIGGVAAGLGRYFNIDPVLVRILFVLLAIFGGGGLIIYILLWIFVPDDQNTTIYNNPSGEQTFNEAGPEEAPGPPASLDANRGSLIAGLILITLGALFLVDRFVPRIDFADLWPLILVVGGIALIINHFNKDKE
ncbi:MAG: PspC domain-containing protein [Bacteroidota bacterium]